MSTRFATWTIAAVLVAHSSKTIASPDDNPLPSKTDEKVGQILTDWQRQSSLWTSLDARFVETDNEPNWGTKEQYSGRVVLMPKGLALVELVKPGGDGQVASTHRIIWKSDEMHEVLPERKEHIIWPIAEGDRGRLPAALALPFLWQVNTEVLKRRYHIALLKEDAETWHMKLTPLDPAGKASFSMVYLQLDRQTYLPRRYVLLSTDGKSTKDYRVRVARSNPPVDGELFQIPEVEGWRVTRIEGFNAWVFRLFRPDLLP